MWPCVHGRLIGSICTQPPGTMLSSDAIQTPSEPRRSPRTIPFCTPILLVLRLGILLPPTPGEAQDAQLDYLGDRFQGTAGAVNDEAARHPPRASSPARPER